MGKLHFGLSIVSFTQGRIKEIILVTQGKEHNNNNNNDTIYNNIISSGMRTFRTLFDLRSDWLMGKWSVLIGREQVSCD